jgi:hypothetical protein
MLRIIIGIIFTAGLMLSQPVEIWISDCAADSGAILLVPIETDNVTGLGIIGVDITLNFRAEVLQAESVLTGNIVPSGWLVLYNANTPGELIIALAGADPLSGAGALCTLKFTVTGRPNDTTSIHFSRCQLNEGSVPCTTDDGLFTVVAVGIENKELGQQKTPINAFPNPFHDYTDISFQLIKKGDIQISIYNTAGEKVKTLDARQRNGLYSIKWQGTKDNGTKCKKGIYYLIIEQDNKILKRKLIKI